jgi:hypothetical protein
MNQMLQINPSSPAHTALSAKEIMSMNLPPQRHLVKGILAVGCNLLAGKPKIGKSWLALQLAVCVSLGKPLFDSITVQKTGVLYFALEDNVRRIKKRLERKLGESELPENLYFETESPRASVGGLAKIENFIREYPDVKLIIVDTLARFRDVSGSNKNSYLEDYSAITGLKKIADKYEITILIIHHLRKFDNTEDPLDNISGTTGITGATDANIVLQRDRKSNVAIMYVEGRDVERQEIDLKFDTNTVSWCLTSPVEKLTPERREIVELLQKASKENKTMSPKEISNALGKNGESIRQLLMKMVSDGDIEYVARGEYTIINNIDNNGNNNNNHNNDND